VALAVSVLSALPRPVVTDNLVSMVAWATAEGGGVGEENEAHFNPLNTTQALNGSYAINADGVQSYASAADGLAATIETLRYPAYAGILAALANEAPPVGTAYSIGASPWGTPAELVTECIGTAEEAVAAYKYPEEANDMLFIKEQNGEVYWFIAAGAASYWRQVPPKAVGMLPAAWLVPDDGTWLALWKVA
jgi:hypothetical protein